MRGAARGTHREKRKAWCTERSMEKACEERGKNARQRRVCAGVCVVCRHVWGRCKVVRGQEEAGGGMYRCSVCGSVVAGRQGRWWEERQAGVRACEEGLCFSEEKEKDIDRERERIDKQKIHRQASMYIALSEPPATDIDIAGWHELYTHV